MIHRFKKFNPTKIAIIGFTILILLALYFFHENQTKAVGFDLQAKISRTTVGQTAVLKDVSISDPSISTIQSDPAPDSNYSKEANLTKRRKFDVCFEQLKIYEKLRCKHLAQWVEGSAQIYVFMLSAANADDMEYERDALSRFELDEQQKKELKDKFVTDRDRLITVMIPDDPKKHLFVMEGDAKDPSKLLPSDGKILQTETDKLYEEKIIKNEEDGTIKWRYSHLLTIDDEASARSTALEQ